MSIDHRPQGALPSSSRQDPATPAAAASDSLAGTADSVTHELGNLLAVMVGQVSLLEPIVQSSTDGRESLAEIKRAIAESVARLHDLAAAIRRANHQNPR